MKLTRSTQAKGAEFYRDVDKGKLISEDYSDDKTTYIIENLPNTVSFIGRILFNPPRPKDDEKQKRDKNRFYDFVNKLVCNNNNDKLTDSLPQIKENERLEDVINKGLSFYGKNLKYDENGLTLKELIINYYSGTCIDDELKSMHDYIQTLIDFKTEKLSKSISNNVIPFEVENNELKPQTQKLRFLFQLLKNDSIDKTTITDFKAKYNYTNLEDQIMSYIIDTFDNERKLSCKRIYDMVLEYNHNFYKDHITDENIDDYNYFLIEIRNHFRKYFPVKNKSNSESDRIRNLERKNAMYYCSDKFVMAQVWKRIVNQLVQGLILYGKLQNYFYDSDKQKWQTDKFNSNGLSEIQIEEAFKKQLFLSLCWGATRLNYFYNYGSQNMDTLNTNQEKDIFLDQNNRSNFYQKIESNIFTENSVKAKIATCYPIGDISNEEICLLLEDIVQSCYAIRNNVFHYKKTTFISINKSILKQRKKCILFINDLLKLDKDKLFNYIDTKIVISKTITYILKNYKYFIHCWLYKEDVKYKNEFDRTKNFDNLINQKIASILKNEKDELVLLLKALMDDINKAEKISNNLLKKDIANIQEQFKEQIRSSCIAEYYSLDTLRKVFKTNNIDFYLYASQYPMMPSFKNVFSRGCNISKGSSHNNVSKWFIDNDNMNKDAHLAYKNLLQLIYYHSFIPAIDKNEELITKFINKTKQWNQSIAIAKQRDKINKYKFKYNDMPNYQNDSNLSNYLSNLQRLQSIKENDESNTKNTNYYTDFVNDIFVLAFNDYLQNRISSLYSDIKEPCKQDETADKILDDLFTSSDLSLKMKTDCTELSKYAGMYLFLKLLDQRELNILLHQFIRYRTSTHNNTEEMRQMEELIALVKFTLPLPKIDENYKENVEKYFSKFIEGNYKTDYIDLYFQDDNKTEILQRSISLIGRSGAMALYTDMFTKQKKCYTVTNQDYKDYCELSSKGSSEVSPIEKMQNELQCLHKEIVLAKKGEDNQEKIAKYEILAKEIQDYNQCREKVTFETLYKVHQIHIDLLGRFASFAEDWERDMFFMLTALKSLGKLHQNFNVNQVFEKGRVVFNLCKNLKTSKQLLCDLCWADGSVDKNSIGSNIQVRNILAHLNHMTQPIIRIGKKENYKEESQPSIIDIINKLRSLLAYDLKRQNAVTKAVKDILFKDYKMKLVLAPVKTKKEPKQFEIKSLCSDSIMHLKKVSTHGSKNGIPIEANSALFVKLVTQLLNFKY